MSFPIARRLGITTVMLLTSAPVLAQDKPSALDLSVPETFDFRQVGPKTPSQRLRDAPTPDPPTLPKSSNSQHDANTGADTTAFGTAYSYANPLYGTTSGSGVTGAVSKSAGPPQTGGGIVLFEWGYPPRPMPKVPGEDLTQAPPPIPQINFAVQADDQPVLDARSRWIVSRAVQAYSRAGLVEITIERPSHMPDCCARYADLIRAELAAAGLGPDQRHLLSGHRIRLVVAARLDHSGESNLAAEQDDSRSDVGAPPACSCQSPRKP